MNKKFYKALTIVFIAAAVISLTAFPALAAKVFDFTASLSAANTNIIAGESVNFIVHVENTGDYDLDYIKISTMRGSLIKAYGELKIGESADIPFSMIMDTIGELAYQFSIFSANLEGFKEVITNTVTITVSSSQPPPQSTPVPSPAPTPVPSPSPTPTPPPEPTNTPTPSAAPEPAQPEPSEGDAGLEQAEQAEMSEEPDNDAVLYIIIGALGTLVIVGAVTAALLLRALRKITKKGIK